MRLLPFFFVLALSPPTARAEALPAAFVPATLEEGPESPPDPSFEPTYVVQRVEVRGNHKTATSLIVREVGLRAGDVVAANDGRVGLARLRLLALGYFLDAHLSLVKGSERGQATLIVEVEERGTIILDALYLGTSEATTLWGGLAATERNLLGHGLSIGGGLVASTRPQVVHAEPGFAGALRVAGPPAFFPGRLALQASMNVSRGSEFFRRQGPDTSANPQDFVAANVQRVGGTLGAGRALSRSFFLLAEARIESIRSDFPAERTRSFLDGTTSPIPFLVREGSSHESTLALTLDFDTRTDPVLPRGGHRVALSIEGATTAVASTYGFLKGTVQSASYFPLPSGHVIGLHGFLGGIVGDAPFFDRFFVGDLNPLLPPRALGLNFSTQPSHSFLGAGMASRRYNDVAGRLLVEYAIPVWSRHGLLYRGDAFAAFGIFAVSNGDSFDRRVYAHAVAADVTADLGLRLDTHIGIFTLSVGNALGRMAF